MELFIWVFLKTLVRVVMDLVSKNLIKGDVGIRSQAIDKVTTLLAIDKILTRVNLAQTICIRVNN